MVPFLSSSFDSEDSLCPNAYILNILNIALVIVYKIDTFLNISCKNSFILKIACPITSVFLKIA